MINESTSTPRQTRVNPHEPPEWSRGKMIVTALKISGAVLLVTAVLFTVLQTDLELAKEQQKVERMDKYFRIAELTINHQVKELGAPYLPTPENTAPLKIADDFAALNGDHAYYKNEGEYARLDMFSPEGAFKSPLRYAANGVDWILISRGPDSDFDLGEELDWEATSWNQLEVLRYDPTNGAMSNGDLWVSSFNKRDLTLR